MVRTVAKSGLGPIKQSIADWTRFVGARLAREGNIPGANYVSVVPPYSRVSLAPTE
jgi:hypothetical protein